MKTVIALLTLIIIATYASCGSGLLTSKPRLTTVKTQARACLQPVNIAKLLKPQHSCYEVHATEFDTVKHFDASRALSPWIPCNKTELFSMVGNHQFDFQGAVEWLAKKPRFKLEHLELALNNPEERHSELMAHPALEAPHHKAMVKLIRNAQSTIFFDAILFGGAWGSEIIREMMLRKKQVDLQIVLLRDAENTFDYRSELVPFWNRLKEFARTEDGFVVLDADLDQRGHSAMPFGLERFLETLSPWVKPQVSLKGRSDHSKLLIVDGFTANPSMVVSSKNPSDFNLPKYDESLIVWGPAAAAAMVSYMADIHLAQAKREREGISTSADEKALLRKWSDLELQARDPSQKGLTFEPQGQEEVRLAETNSDNSVRNTETTLLSLIQNAQKSIRMYNFLAYNPMVARALADAVKRLGANNVKVIGDATLTLAANVTFADFLQDELKEHGLASTADQVLRWRNTLPPVHLLNRTSIIQQQHTKSVIVDEDSLFLGSTNFDVATLGGAFREFSVVVRRSAAPQQSAREFDKIWSTPHETLTTAEILRTGGPTQAKMLPSAVRAVLGNTIRTEQSRIRALNPRNISRDPICH